MKTSRLVLHLGAGMFALSIVAYALLHPEMSIEFATPLLSYKGTILGLDPVLLVLVSIAAVGRTIAGALTRQARRKQ